MIKLSIKKNSKREKNSHLNLKIIQKANSSIYLYLHMSLLKSFLGSSVVSCPDDGSLGGQPVSDILSRMRPEAGQVIP